MIKGLKVISYASAMQYKGTDKVMPQIAAELGIEYDAVDSLGDAINNFKAGKTDAIVYDKAMLDYVSKDIEDVDVFPIENSDEYYGIALPQGSELKEFVPIENL